MILGSLAHRVLAVAVATTLAATGLVGAAAPAQAAACSGTNGVTVVVQSSAGTSTRCASGDPSSAMAALRATGHSVTQPSRFPGAICRIDGYPASDPCVNMPPADAYWAFFHGPAGGAWTYSDSGPSSHDPKPGSSVGFRFGSGSAPSTRPAAPAPAPKPTTAAPRPTTAAPRPTTAAPRATTAPRRTSSPTRTAAGPATSAPGLVRPGSAGVARSGGPSGPSASVPAPSTSPSPSASASATVEALGAQEPPSTGAGSSGRLVGGGVLLLALASAVGAVALRRRAAGA